MKKILALFVYLCSVPVGLLLKISGRNRYKGKIDKKMKSYRCTPDKVTISSHKSDSRIQQSDDDVDCPDTIYPMW
jgi:hypothetical protein